LFDFFESILPGTVNRAEVLLDTEYLAGLISKRREHIIAYENTFSKKVHQLATYYRDVDVCKNGGFVKRNCRKKIFVPKRPKEPKTTVVFDRKGDDLHNAFIEGTTRKVRDTKRVCALQYYHDEISNLNKQIEDEYIRLAREQKRPVKKYRENRISKWLRLRYLRKVETGSVHSSTAFVEFKSSVAKQAAIQCNLAGTSGLVSVRPVPEIRDMIWSNAHVSLRLIKTRKMWASFGLGGVLIAWSCIVALIRRVENISNDYCRLELCENELIATVVDDYLPALVVEGIVRAIPFLLRYMVRWIRFKTVSETDLYVLKWYFGRFHAVELDLCRI
jgi:hypothetical protein